MNGRTRIAQWQTGRGPDVPEWPISGARMIRGSRAYLELQDWPLLDLEMPVFMDLEQLSIISPLPFSGDVTPGQTLRLSTETAIDIINSQQVILPGCKLKQPCGMTDATLTMPWGSS